MRSSSMTTISRMPTGIATARQLMEMSSDMIADDRFVLHVVQAGSSRAASKTSMADRASSSRRSRMCGAARLTRAVIRICSLRRSASTPPSIASHKNSSEAVSSDQISGLWKA